MIHYKALYKSVVTLLNTV